LSNIFFPFRISKSEIELFVCSICHQLSSWAHLGPDLWLLWPVFKTYLYLCLDTKSLYIYGGIAKNEESEVKNVPQDSDRCGFLFYARSQTLLYIWYQCCCTGTLFSEVKIRHYNAGLPDFSWYKIPKRGEIYQMTTKYTILT
jgi:hypothetical protein